MDNKSKTVIYSILLLFILYLIYSSTKSVFIGNQLEINSSFTQGYIVDCTKFSKRTGGNIEYKFYINNKEFTGNKTYSEIDEFKCKDFIGKGFAIAYDSVSTSNNEILITKEDYQRYGIPYPDSLQWVSKYFYPFE